MTEPTVSTEDLFLILYCIVDELYQDVAPDAIRFRNGAERMEMTDPEIITLPGSCKKDAPTTRS